MCQTGGSHGPYPAGGCSCGCCGCGCGSFQRRFFTEKEKKQMLEDYREQLKKELEGLEEHIQEFKC